MEQDTIVALATPLGNAGISVVRLSGNDSLKIATNFFVSKKLKKHDIQPRYMYLGDIDTQDLKEKCLMVYFKNPYSYTGEDVVEFQCHGGTYICNKIIDLCIKFGARLAQPGEFTKRAFINGKVSLDEAEGVVDLINAKTASEVKASFDLVKGDLYKTVKVLQDTLTQVLAEIEVNLDYPEHDIEYQTEKQLYEKLTQVKQTLLNLSNTEYQGRIIRDGINVAILGKPNVGKSSLMNALLNYERAIVTDIAGTTRDTLQESFIYKDTKINITDTAGLHESNDIVEKIGIQKAIEQINQADLILLLLDGSSELSKEDKENLNLVKGKKVIIVENKTDLPQKLNLDFPTIKISAKNNKNIDLLKQKILDSVLDKDFVQNDLVLTNKRHVIAIKQALELIENAINNIYDVSLDCTALDVKQAWLKLGEITGETTDEEIIDMIFSKFCLGK